MQTTMKRPAKEELERILMDDAAFQAALRLRRTWFTGAHLATRIAHASVDNRSRTYRRCLKAAKRANDAKAVAMFVPTIFMSAAHGNAVEQALFLRDRDHYTNLHSHAARIRTASQRCFGTASLHRDLAKTSVGKALRLVAVVPEFVEVLARCTLNQPPVLHVDAAELAIDLYKRAVATGTWPVFAGLCRESPATLAEAWQLATLLSTPAPDTEA